MSWRDAAVQDIKRCEACRLEAYQDEGGVWTIGWGHTQGVVQGQTCTQTQADEWLEQDFSLAEFDLNTHVCWWLDAPPSVRRGLVNMSFNLGWPRLSGFKHMLACGEIGDWEGMASESLDSKWATQVGDRADFIAELFRLGNQLELVV